MNTISYTERCEIYKRALLLFGTDAQIKMFFEEAAELQNALCKLARGRDSADHVAEEIADLVQNGLVQLQLQQRLQAQVKTDKGVNGYEIPHVFHVAKAL